MKFEHTAINGKNYLAAEGEMDCPGYMTDMISIVKPKNMIPFSLIKTEKGARVLYETDVAVSLKEYMEDKGINENEVRELLRSVDGIFSVCGEYLLDEKRILLDSDMIYISGKPGNAQFIFSPMHPVESGNSCRKLFADILGNYYTRLKKSMPI